MATATATFAVARMKAAAAALAFCRLQFAVGRFLLSSAAAKAIANRLLSRSLIVCISGFSILVAVVARHVRVCSRKDGAKAAAAATCGAHFSAVVVAAVAIVAPENIIIGRFGGGDKPPPLHATNDSRRRRQARVACTRSLSRPRLAFVCARARERPNCSTAMSRKRRRRRALSSPKMRGFLRLARFALSLTQLETTNERTRRKTSA